MFFFQGWFNDTRKRWKMASCQTSISKLNSSIVRSFYVRFIQCAFFKTHQLFFFKIIHYFLYRGGIMANSFISVTSLQLGYFHLTVLSVIQTAFIKVHVKAFPFPVLKPYVIYCSFSIYSCSHRHSHVCTRTDTKQNIYKSFPFSVLLLQLGTNNVLIFPQLFNLTYLLTMSFKDNINLFLLRYLLL